MGLNARKNKRKIYLGIEILRMILSFLIVIVHLYYKGYARKPILLFPFQNLCFYIPTFFIISFYFSYNCFISKNIVKINHRFKRILIPYFILPHIFWLRNNFYNYYYRTHLQSKFKNLYYQLLIGCGLHGVFWFHFNLIFISVLFIIIIFLFTKRYLLILLIIGIISYNFNYTKLRKVFFLNYNFIPVSHSIKPLTNNLIFAIIGFYLSLIHILNKLYKCRIAVIIIMIFLIYLIKKYQKIFFIYHFFNELMVILVSTSLFIFFGLIPLDKIKNSIIIFIIKQITSYTGGIYYLHPEIRESFLKKWSKLVRLRTFKGCLLVYITTYFICLIGSKIFKKSNLKYLFI